MAKKGRVESITGQDKEFAAPGIEGQKDSADVADEPVPVPDPEVIRGEDVLAMLRSQGKKV